MQRLKLDGLISTIALLLCTAIAAVCAPGFAPAQAQIQNTPFSLNIAGPQAAVKSGDACEVTVLLTNQSDKQILVGVHNGPQQAYKDFETSITSESSGAALTQDTSRVNPLGPIYSQHSSAASKRLEPGESIQSSLPICDLYDLSLPGTYRV